MRSTVLALLLVLFAQRALPQEFPEDYTKLLLPLTAIAVPGANGSVWTTEWTLFNGTRERLYVSGPFPYLSLSPPVQDNDVDAGTAKRLIAQEARPGFDGAFIYLPTAELANLPMSLRVRDITVNAQSYGTSIPIVKADEFRTKVHLIDVPTDPAYRTMLRIYSAGTEIQVARIAVYRPQGRGPIAELDVVLHPQSPFFGEIDRPAYAQLYPVSEAVRAAGPKVRIEISSASPVWAFVSISHNQTQQVTTVVPTP